MIKKKIVIYGAGGHAKSCIEVIESQKKFKIIGLIGRRHELNKKILGYKIIGTDKDIKKIKKITKNIVNGVGSIKTNSIRKKIFLKLKSIGFNFPQINASTSYVSSKAKIDEGSIIFHNTFINADAIIGKNCIINSGTIIEHDTIISDHCNISTSVTINGNAKVGSNTFIGSGSKIIQSIKISKNSLIPMFSKIKK